MDPYHPSHHSGFDGLDRAPGSFVLNGMNISDGSMPTPKLSSLFQDLMSSP